MSDQTQNVNTNANANDSKDNQPGISSNDSKRHHQGDPNNSKKDESSQHVTHVGDSENLKEKKDA